MRRKDREITDAEEIRRILSRARVLHLGLNDDEGPYVVPMHYGFLFENGKLTLYTHCAREGHKLSLIRRGDGAAHRRGDVHGQGASADGAVVFSF